MQDRALIVTDAVKLAWQASLPSVRFDPRRSWGEIGVDSLKSMEFVLRLERMLGVRVAFDGMTPDSTADDFICLLARAPDMPANPDKAQIFLVPAMLGDEPSLAQLRRALGRHVAFETLALPDLEAPAHVLEDFGATAAILTEEIIRRRPDGDIRIAGFSYGALLAHEIACRLEASGRHVAFLALLDGLLYPSGPSARTVARALRRLVGRDPGRKIPPAESAAGSPLRLGARLQIYLDNAILIALVAVRAHETARRFLLGAARRHDAAWVAVAQRRREFLRILRTRAGRGWKRGRCTAPTLLVMSDDFPAQSSVQEWRAMCPDLQAAAIPAAHLRIFEPAAMAAITPIFLAALSGERLPRAEGVKDK